MGVYQCTYDRNQLSLRNFGFASRKSRRISISSRPFAAISTWNSGLSSGFMRARSSRKLHVTMPLPSRSTQFSLMFSALLLRALTWLLYSLPWASWASLFYFSNLRYSLTLGIRPDTLQKISANSILVFPNSFAMPFKL